MLILESDSLRILACKGLFNYDKNQGLIDELEKETG